MLRRQIPATVACLVLAIIAPFFSGYAVGVLVHLVALAIAAVGLDLIISRANMLSFSHAAFMAIGAYVSVILMRNGWEFIFAALVGIASAAIAGFLLAIPASRLSGFSFALVTFAFSAVVTGLAAGSQLISIAGGESGLSVPPGKLFDLNLFNPHTLFYVALVLLLATMLVCTTLIYSRTGRAFRTMKESEAVAVALGVNVAGMKIGVFALSAGIAGVGGVVLSQALGAISAPTFSLEQSTILVAAVTVGGLGRSLGPLVGITIFVLLPEIFQGLQDYSALVFAAVFVVTLILAPNGVVGLVTSFPSWVRQILARKGDGPGGFGTQTPSLSSDNSSKVAS